jgi:hypothetical protein
MASSVLGFHFWDNGYFRHSVLPLQYPVTVYGWSVRVLVTPAFLVSRRSSVSQRWRAKHRCDLPDLACGRLTCGACWGVESRAMGGKGRGRGSGGEDELSSVMRFNYNLLYAHPNHSTAGVFCNTNSNYFSWNFSFRGTNSFMPRAMLCAFVLTEITVR